MDTHEIFDLIIDRKAEQYVRSLIQRINKRACFVRAGVEWSLVRSCGRSWVRDLVINSAQSPCPLTVCLID